MNWNSSSTVSFVEETSFDLGNQAICHHYLLLLRQPSALGAINLNFFTRLKLLLLAILHSVANLEMIKCHEYLHYYNLRYSVSCNKETCKFQFLSSFYIGLKPLHHIFRIRITDCSIRLGYRYGSQYGRFNLNCSLTNRNSSTLLATIL